MNNGAIAIASDKLQSLNREEAKKIFDFLEKNVTDQRMIVNHYADMTYILGKSELFTDTEFVCSKYPVYSLIISETEISIYKTVSSIQI